MRTRLKGIHKVPVKLKDGREVVYHYHNATRRRLYGEPGSAEYLAAYAAAEIELAARQEQHRALRSYSLWQAVDDFKSSDSFSKLSLRTRSGLLSVIVWLAPKDTRQSVTKITAAYAHRLRDKAARSHGVTFGNYTLLLLQSVIGHCVANGTLATNPVLAIPKLIPPRIASNNRRSIPSERTRRPLRPINTQVRNNRATTDGPDNN